MKNQRLRNDVAIGILADNLPIWSGQAMVRFHFGMAHEDY
jgi:hypothetical protein